MYRRVGQVVSLVVALCCISCRAPQDEAQDSVESAPSSDRRYLNTEWTPVEPGPWGNLEFRQFFLPLPPVWNQSQPNSEPVCWRVPKFTPERMNAMVTSGPLTDEEKKLWLETCRLEASDEGLKIYPSKEFRWLLRPESRALLYRWLGKFPENQQLALPATYPAATQENWFKNSNQRPEICEAITHLQYPAGQVVCFADFDLLEEYLNGPAERADLVSTLHRQPCTEIRLCIDQKTDLKKLATYWGEGNRVERVRDILKQALGKQTAASIPLEKILPTLPRSLLNTYPSRKQAPGQPPPNCSWTALNFFNRKPDIQYTDWTLLEDILRKDHDHLHSNPRYGDTVALLDANGRPLHVATYLGGGFVFTKNGGHLTKPWVIMKLEDVRASYSSSTSPQVAFYRWNPLKSRPPAT